MGSRITAATVSSTAAASATVSPNGTNVTSAGIGSNGARFAGWPVIARAPIVRPWNAFSAATIRVRPVSRESLNAASLASAPELVNNTRPSPAAPEMSSNRSASAITPGWVKKFETCPRVEICSVTARTTAG